MQRRTNLFYTTGADSDFITFSNYTESLTGNFLATDWKMFPSKFICLKLPISTQTDKTSFVKALAAYYENKLAFLRDYCVNNNLKVENYMHPLAWLIEFIDKRYTNTSGEKTYKISFIGGVSEHNYNGTYADTICAIDATYKAQTYKININNSALEPKKYEFSKTYLYGWYNVTSTDVEVWQGISDYEDVQPQFDLTEGTNVYYYLGTNIDSIEVDTTVPELSSIDFNVIIPLFDLVNKNPNTNTNDPTEVNDNILEFDINEGEKIANIPIGVWFANKNISLERDTNGYAPTWSLVLSSQFKPFPYSNDLVDESNQSEPANGFGTFAHVLSRQNSIMSTFSKVSTDINILSQKIGEVEGKVSTLATTYAIDSIKCDVINYKKQVDNVIENNSEAASTSISNLQTQVDNLSDYVYNISEHLTDSITITQNGTYNVAAYGTAVVNVSGTDGNINLSDVYTENISSKIYENVNSDIYGNYRDIYFTLNCNKSTILDCKDYLHISLYKYRNRNRLKKVINVGGTENINHSVQQYRFTLQNDVAIEDDNLKLHCFVSKPYIPGSDKKDTNPKNWKYYYISNEVNNNISVIDPNINPATLVIYVHRNTTSSTTFDEPIIANNNYALLINNLVKYTGTIDLTTLERASAYDVNKYVKVPISQSSQTKDAKINDIINNSIITRVIQTVGQPDETYDSYTRYADDYRIVPTLLNDCEILVTTDLASLTNNKIVKRPGEKVKLSELAQEDFLNDKFFPNIIFIMPWNTYYIIMRYFKNDYCTLANRDRLQQNLKLHCKGMTSTKIFKNINNVKKYKWTITLPLEFTLLTTDEILHNYRGKSQHIKRNLSFSKAKTDTTSDTKYSGIQKLV